MASYLEYLADRAVEAIHPFGSAATEVMIAMMDLHPGAKLLEIGCGTGITMFQVAADTRSACSECICCIPCSAWRSDGRAFAVFIRGPDEGERGDSSISGTDIQ